MRSAEEIARQYSGVDCASRGEVHCYTCLVEVARPRVITQTLPKLGRGRCAVIVIDASAIEASIKIQRAIEYATAPLREEIKRLQAELAIMKQHGATIEGRLSALELSVGSYRRRCADSTGHHWAYSDEGAVMDYVAIPTDLWERIKSSRSWGRETVPYAKLFDDIATAEDPEPCAYNLTGYTCVTHGQSRPCLFDAARSTLAKVEG